MRKLFHCTGEREKDAPAWIMCQHCGHVTLHKFDRREQLDPKKPQLGIEVIYRCECGWPRRWGFESKDPAIAH